MKLYMYRRRELTAHAMKPLIVELFSGQEAVPRQEIIKRCEKEHLRRGGINRQGEQLIIAFKSAVKHLRQLGIVEDAGYGYWHIIGGFSPDEALKPIPRDHQRSDGKVLSRQERKLVKQTLYGKQEGRCAGCRRTLEFQDLTLDHIQPLSKGGSHDESNLQLLSIKCNSSKGART